MTDFIKVNLILHYSLFFFICYFMSLLVSVSIFMDWQKLEYLLTFVFSVLIHANDFSCYLCLSLCTKVCVFIEPTTSIPAKRVFRSIITRCVFIKGSSIIVNHFPKCAKRTLGGRGCFKSTILAYAFFF